MLLNVIASISSCHTNMEMVSPTAIRPGIATGRIILKRIFKLPQPSMRAASSIIFKAGI